MNKINSRIYLFTVITSIILIIMIIKLFTIFYLHGDGFINLASKQNSVTVTEEMPRGEIYDRNQVLLVGNKQTENLMYVDSGIMDNEQKLEVAQKITSIVKVDASEINQADLKTLYINQYEDQYDDGRNKLFEQYLTDSQRQQYDDLEMSLDEAYAIVSDNITQQDINQLFDGYSIETIYVRTLMDQASASNSVVIKENLSVEEQYALGLEFGQIGGFYVTTDWQRVYPEGDALRSFLGNVGPITEETWDYYSSLGYSLNEEVGTSYVEYEMESILRGKPKQYNFIFDAEGNIIDEEEIDQGNEGNDVILTIDIELQKKIEEIVTGYLAINQGSFLNDIFVTLSDPNTGDILAIVGESKTTDGEIYENSIGNFTKAYEAGSIVKPAVLLTAYGADKWERDTVVVDEPMYIKGTPVKSSFHDYGPVDEREAIAVSSNVYFWNVALSLADSVYTPNQPLDIQEEDFIRLRRGLSEFGLGTSTGIDFEAESTGVQGTDFSPGFYLDLTIGQYDTYTNLQVNQYISTIANGGKRMKYNYVQSINQPGEFNQPGVIIQEPKSTVLNTLSMSDSDIAYVQELLLAPVNDASGTAWTLKGEPYNPTGKTGTSESFYYDPEEKTVYPSYNSTFIGYAPYDDPEVAVSVALPYYIQDGQSASYEARDIAQDSFQAYFELYPLD